MAKVRRGKNRLGMAYSFDDFVLDPSGHSLSRGGEALHVEPQVLALLLYLVEQRARIVSKSELIEEVWGGRVISDAALNTCVRSVRRVLGDDAARQRYVRTFPKRGFQFVGTLRSDDGAAAAPPGRKETESRPRRRRGPLVAASLLLAFLLIGAFWWLLDRHEGEAGLPLPGKPSLAVLRFDNLSDDPGQDYFVDGLIADLVSGLSLDRELFIVSPSSTFRYAEEPVDVGRIGRELGVAYVLSGSIRRSDDRIRVNAELLDARSGSTLWSERFDRELTDVFAVQDEISRSIVGRISPEVLRARADQARNQPTESLDAWDLYLQARAAQLVSSAEGQAEAIRLAQTAIARDPDFAAPHALIARAKGFQFFHQWTDDPERTLAEAIESARAAIRLDANNPLAYAALGYVYRLTGDEIRSIGNLERARDLNPNDAGIRLELAHALDWFRQQERALPEILEAIRLSPRDPRLELMYFYKAHILFHLREFDASLVAASEMAGALTSETWRTFYHLVRAANLAYLGREVEARSEIERAREIRPKLSLASIRKRFEGSQNHPENRRIWLDALGQAGLPEH